MLTLPTDPEPVVTKGNKQIEIDLVDTVALPHMQDAVRDYRRRLLPAIFVTAQKVFAELFRVVLGAAGHSAGNRPFDVEQALQPLVTAGSISVWHPFTDAAHLSSWWDGQYNFTKLRLARNQVLHNTYSFAGGRLYVRNDAGVGLVDWCENDILEFAGAVAEIGKRT
jgi:DNA-binding transcriptional LysR family regulator